MEGLINISGQIGSTDTVKGVELIDIITQVKSQPMATSFRVVINSQGGIVETGVSIHDYLKSLQLPITTVGQTLVASIATVVFMAGDTRILNEGTRFMIHLPKGEVQGTANEIESYAKSVRDAEKFLIDFYKKATNTTEEAIQPLLLNETWLSPEQALSLGFTTKNTPPIMAVAFFKNNLNNNNQMTQEDKNWLETLFAPIKALIKKPIQSITVADADGKLIDFPELVDGDVPKIDDKATVDGQPAEGEFLQTDGTTFVFVGGVLSEIKQPEPKQGEDMEALKAERDALKIELAKVTSLYEVLQTSVVTLKKQITSRFDTEDKKENKKEEQNNNRKLIK